jgi:hypothetical protein
VRTRGADAETLGMSCSYDHRPEFRRRAFTALGCSLVAAVAGALSAAESAPFFALLASMLGGVAGFVLPVPGGKLFSRGHGAAPDPVRPGNPLVAQRSQSLSWLALCTVLAFSGCMGVTVLEEPPDTAQLDVLIVYACAGILWLLIVAQRTWLELEVGSLQILRHRTLFGLRRSTVLSDSNIRFVVCCRASSGAYDVFAFSRDRQAFPLNGTYTGREDATFQAERLADQLMVPLLEGYADSNWYEILKFARTRPDDQMPFSRSWQAAPTPPRLAAKRSELPPLP